MKNNRSILRRDRRIAAVLCTVLLFTLLFPQLSFAAETQTVRLGYYQQPGFQEGIGDDERKSGYAFEYLQKISDYTGWKYEYIYEDPDALKEMMAKGQVDLIAGISPGDAIPPGAALADHPFFAETCYIYTVPGDDLLKSGSADELAGRRIGTAEGSPAQAYLNQFVESSGIACAIVSFDSHDAVIEALKDGTIDAFAANDMTVGNTEGVAPALEIGRDYCHVCVASGKEALLQQLNQADDMLRSEEPFFLNHLYMQYFQNTSESTAQSDEEAAWLLEHDTLRIGYLKNYLPFCGTEADGSVSGLLKDYIATLKSEPELSGLTIETVPYDCLDSAYKDLMAQNIDVIFPAYRDAWYAEIKNARESNAVFSQTIDLIFEGVYTPEVTDKIALSSTNTILRGYIQIYYPDSEIIVVDSWDECIDAIKSGRATCTLMNRYKTSMYLQRAANQSLRSTGIPNPCDLCFVVRSSDVELLSLLNRGIRIMGSEQIDRSVNSYIYYDYDYSIRSFLSEHVTESVLTVSFFILFLLAVFLFYIRSTKRNQRRMEMAQEEIKEARDQLADALDKAEAASQAKSTFLFNMSHDIRTPMNAILGFADLLEKYDDDPDRRREYTRNIRTSGGYLLDLINEVLEMARIESGQITLNEEPGNLREMIHSLDIIFREDYQKKELQMFHEIAIDQPDLYFDFTKERAIYLNIASNAIKYTPAGGSIFVRIEELPGADEEHIITRSVIRDTGIGMSKDFLPHIFDSFSRERNATESRIMGTGLGMGIVKRYVDLMGGTITVESEVGKGTEVTLEIPHRIVKAPKASEAVPAADKNILQGKTVLVAEDNELNREIARELLTDAGLQVQTAADGMECVSILNGHPAGTFDFILMDIQMPNMDGIKATVTIRQMKDRAKANIPIIAMTANVFDTDRKRAMEAGMDGFAGKPVQVEELSQELVRVLSGDRGAEKTNGRPI